MTHRNKKIILIIVMSLFVIFFQLLIPNSLLAMQTNRIVIDPGHGGIDYGCTIGNLFEKDITLDISKKVKKCLEDRGYTVLMTRDSDVSLYKQSKVGDTIQRRDLNARVNMINNINPDIFVSIHVNSYQRDTSINGSTVFYFSDKYVKSKQLAQCIQKSLNNLSINGQKRMSHNSRPEDYYILRKTAMSGVLVETAFISNSWERKHLTTSEYKQKIAELIALGIVRYMNDSK
jgi:N-acetylmuramoyl-L-alanine amidase